MNPLNLKWIKRKMKLGTPFKEVKLNFIDTIISEQNGNFRNVAQYS